MGHTNGQTRVRQERWITGYDKATERTFFFYATIFMLIIWVLSMIFGS